MADPYPIMISHFKLCLQDDISKHYAIPLNSSKATTAKQEGFSLEGEKHLELSKKTPYNYVENFLREIRKYLLETYLHLNYGQTFFSQNFMRYILIVPTIWSDKAKDLT